MTHLCVLNWSPETRSDSAAGEVNNLEGQRDSQFEAVKALYRRAGGHVERRPQLEARTGGGTDMGRIVIAACEVADMADVSARPATIRYVTPGAYGHGPARQEDAAPESCREGRVMPPRRRRRI